MCRSVFSAQHSFSFRSKVTYIVYIPKPRKLPLTQTICDLLGKNNSYQGLLKKEKIFLGIIIKCTKQNKTCQSTGNSRSKVYTGYRSQAGRRR